MCLIVSIYQADHTVDGPHMRIYLRQLSDKDNQIPFDSFMYSPIAPRRLQDARVRGWKCLRLPQSVTLDEAVLSNHLNLR
jgi:hypothetical protein